MYSGNSGCDGSPVAVFAVTTFYCIDAVTCSGAGTDYRQSFGVVITSGTGSTKGSRICDGYPTSLPTVSPFIGYIQISVFSSFSPTVTDVFVYEVNTCIPFSTKYDVSSQKIVTHLKYFNTVIANVRLR